MHRLVEVRQRLVSGTRGAGFDAYDHWLRTLICSCGEVFYDEESLKTHIAKMTAKHLADGILESLKEAMQRGKVL